ncbi:hypothetical protein PRIPAC_88335 [Pristionchus pacificus]|uniref:Uncharacterized protein n=1 Tax=Pristionchus pacificus TaxID=54126 RepID=A0A2A6B5T0_PRIPA|nr:hypothetical protein PRIPAC_88335 [Pristionchus pacificus]|eukprot:PDM61208.1 hypothetical protein PRIPAC_50650 [Pristionchus pacificus]
MSETVVKKVKKEEPDDDYEIQIVHVNLRVPIVIPPETASQDSTTPILRPLQQQQAATTAATPRLLPDAQSSRAVMDYWMGKRNSNKCPRCSEVLPLSKTTRIEHYKIWHYDVFYASDLSTTRLMTPLTRWMAINLGSTSGIRVCLLCVRMRGHSYFFLREMLVKHIEKTHPSAFVQLLSRYHHLRAINFDSSMGIPQSLMTATTGVDNVTAFPTCTVAGSDSSPVLETTAAAAAVAASPDDVPTEAAATASPTTLALDAPPSPLDEDYWRGKNAPGLGRVSCPRCSYNSASGKGHRKLHYKRVCTLVHHYNVYYQQTRSNRTTTRLTQWMAVHFGDVLKKAPRVCVYCVGDVRYNSDYRCRADLIRHIQQAHPLAMVDLVREYSVASSNSPIADAEIHGLLVHAQGHQGALRPSVSNDQSSLKPTEADDLTQTVTNEENGIGNGFTAEIWQSAGNVSSSMLLTAAAMPLTSLALDAPPSPLDEEYWRRGNALKCCPRCVYDSADNIGCRKKHYRRHHYDIYYVLAPGHRNLAPLLKFLVTHFGNVRKDMRSCLLCEGERRYWLGYRSRADLIRHMEQCHSHALIDLAREYSVTSNGLPVSDCEVHRLLMNTLVSI